MKAEVCEDRVLAFLAVNPQVEFEKQAAIVRKQQDAAKKVCAWVADV